MKNLKDKVVFITGGARGLGYAMAEKFAAEGAKIVIGDIRKRWLWNQQRRFRRNSV